MALQVPTHTLPFGLSPTNVYARVEVITHENKTSMDFYVRYYVSAADADTMPALPGDGIYTNVPFAIAGANDWAQAYAYLKTLPEFAGAADV